MHGATFHYVVIVTVLGSEGQYSKSCRIPELFYWNWEKGSQNCGLPKKIFSSVGGTLWIL